MKKFSGIMLLTILFVLFLSSTAFAYVPRWPEPAWFARFNTAQAPQPVPAPQPAPSPTPAPSAPAQAPSQSVVLTPAERHVFDAINRERVARGIQPLKLNPALVELARKKSQDMVDNNYFAHQSPVYGRASDMMRSAGIRFNYAGENLARTTSAANAVNLFMNSGTHRSTLLNPRFSETGVGIVQIGRQIYVTQMFIGFMN